MTRGTTSEVEFLSEPAGALVLVSSGPNCTTPCKLKFPRRDEFTATFKLAGYKDAAVDVRSQLAGAGAAGLAGNLIVGGAIGIGVDAISGATLEHVPNPVSVVMERLAGPAPKTAPKARPVEPPKAKAEPAAPVEPEPPPPPPSGPIKPEYRPGRPDRIL